MLLAGYVSFLRPDDEYSAKRLIENSNPSSFVNGENIDLARLPKDLLGTTIIDKTVGKVSTFHVFIASLPFPLIQCCAKLNAFSGKLLSYLPTLNRGQGAV